MATTQPDAFERIAQSIAPERGCAKLLLQEAGGRLDWHRAREILRQVSPAPIGCDVLVDGSPAVVVFRLRPEDLPEALLRLTGAGFIRLKALDARRTP